MVENAKEAEIDVHIVLGSLEPWLVECLDSLKDENVNVHFINKVDGDVASAREYGFRKGNAKYVSFVDPDDIVVQGSFQKCLEAIKANPDCVGAYTSDVLVDEKGNFICDGWATNEAPFTEMGFPKELTAGVHHLRVFKREFVEKCLPLKSKMIPEPLLNLEIQKYGKLIHVPVVGYKWRQHGNNTFKKYSPNELAEAISIAREFIKQINHIDSDPLIDFFLQWYERPIYRAPYESSVICDGNIWGTVLYRHNEFQVQLFTIAPNTVFPSHRHPNVDAFEIYLSGDIEFFVNRTKVLGQEEHGKTDEGFTLMMGKSFRVRPEDWHHAVIGPRGGSFISVQRWMNGAKPTNVGFDWIAQGEDKRRNYASA